MKYNFLSGPATLPSAVLEQASKGILNFKNSELSLLEVSHRGSLFQQVLEQAKQDLRELLGLSDSKEILFLHSGASMQFCMIPYNFLERKAGYVSSGIWADKAIDEARFFGETNIVSSSKESEYQFYPAIPSQDFSDLDYLHITSNNTIYGTQIHELPKVNCPLVVDMSSDILSKKYDYDSCAVIYAGLQKNLGAAGATLVILDTKKIKKSQRKIPTILDYDTHIKNKSLFNTPCVFAIYVCALMLDWAKNSGGISYFEKINTEKAALLYQEIDRNDLLTARAEKDSRSQMNVVFNLIDEKLEKSFIDFCAENDLVGLEGHRTIGGCRASLYNAMPIEGVKKLVNTMQEFEKKFG